MKSHHSTVRIAEGVEWQARHAGDTFSAFPETSLPDLGKSGLAQALETANPHGIIDRLGEEIGVSSEHGNVREVAGHPDLVVKIDELPFSYAAVNIALEAGLAAGGSRFSTPQYHGVMTFLGGRAGESAKNYKATIMSRDEGSPLASILRSKEAKETRDRLLSEMQIATEVAAARVGMDPALVHWDQNLYNFHVPRGTRLYYVAKSPVTILDQNASKHLDPRDWENVVSSEYELDPRDAAADQASDEAWRRFYDHQN